MKTMTAPANLTIAHLDEECDFSPLDTALEKALPEGCRSVEFFDDTHKNGFRELEYRCQIKEDCVQGTGSRWEAEPSYVTENVSVKVHPEMDIDMVVRLLIQEIIAYVEYHQEMMLYKS